jgi:hypothetical protein
MRDLYRGIAVLLTGEVPGRRPPGLAAVRLSWQPSAENADGRPAIAYGQVLSWSGLSESGFCRCNGMRLCVRRSELFEHRGGRVIERVGRSYRPAVVPIPDTSFRVRSAHSVRSFFPRVHVSADGDPSRSAGKVRVVEARSTGT